MASDLQDDVFWDCGKVVMDPKFKDPLWKKVGGAPRIVAFQHTDSKGKIEKKAFELKDGDCFFLDQHDKF